jgi:hypothetical protein
LNGTWPTFYQPEICHILLILVLKL